MRLSTLDERPAEMVRGFARSCADSSSHQWLELALANVLVLVLVNALLHLALALAGVSAESAPENAGNCRVFDGKLSKFVLGIRAIINDV
jgi:hypothetical protein